MPADLISNQRMETTPDSNGELMILMPVRGQIGQTTMMGTGDSRWTIPQAVAPTLAVLGVSSWSSAGALYLGCLLGHVAVFPGFFASLPAG